MDMLLSAVCVALVFLGLIFAVERWVSRAEYRAGMRQVHKLVHDVEHR